MLFSFALFFAMILGDAGYGLVLGGLLGVFWRRMGQAQLGRRMRIMGLLIVSLSVVYGIFAGSYFGVPPPADSLLAKVRFLKLDDFDMMMRISILIGAAHVALANVMRAANRSRWRERVEPLAWIAVASSWQLSPVASAWVQGPDLRTGVSFSRQNTSASTRNVARMSVKA